MESLRIGNHEISITVLVTAKAQTDFNLVGLLKAQYRPVSLPTGRLI